MEKKLRYRKVTKTQEPAGNGFIPPALDEAATLAKDGAVSDKKWEEITTAFSKNIWGELPARCVDFSSFDYAFRRHHRAIMRLQPDKLWGGQREKVQIQMEKIAALYKQTLTAAIYRAYMEGFREGFRRLHLHCAADMTERQFLCMLNDSISQTEQGLLYFLPEPGSKELGEFYIKLAEQIRSSPLSLGI